MKPESVLFTLDIKSFVISKYEDSAYVYTCKSFWKPSPFFFKFQSRKFFALMLETDVLVCEIAFLNFILKGRGLALLNP